MIATDSAVLPRRHASHRRRAESGSRAVPRGLTVFPLVAILAVQVALTARLLGAVGSDHGDEAIYIYSGHQLIYQMLHGGGSPYYETWYSGAPVIYPVIAALVDHLGGLILVREMSLLFMCITSILLYLTTRKLYGYWPALASVGLFAGLGVTQNLGALATFDAMSLMLLAFAAYAAVRANDSARWLLIIPVALLAANATKYVSVLFDPFVIGLAALRLRPHGWRRAVSRAAALSGTALLVIVTSTLVAGGAYINGITLTTLSRKAGTQMIFNAHYASTHEVISLSWSWIGAVVVLGCLGLLVCMLRPAECRFQLPILALLVIAGLVITLGNIRLQTAQSMEKHDDFGIWFTCIAGGYALARTAELATRWQVRLTVVLVCAVAVICSGLYNSQSAKLDTYFSATSLQAYEKSDFSFLAPYLERGSREYLLGSVNSYEILYDNHSSIAWYQFFDDTYIKYPIPGRGGNSHGQTQGLICGDQGQPAPSAPGCAYLEGAAGYRAAIRAHWFALITLVDDHAIGTDAVILAAVRATPGYVLLTNQGDAPTYIYAPDYPGLVHRRRVLTPRPPPRSGTVRENAVPGARGTARSVKMLVLRALCALAPVPVTSFAVSG